MFKTDHEEFVIFILLELPCSFPLHLQSCLLKVTTISLTKNIIFIDGPRWIYTRSYSGSKRRSVLRGSETPKGIINKKIFCCE